MGSSLIEKLKEIAQSTSCKYIALETDAENNEVANQFYMTNGFILQTTFETREKRRMNEYRFFIECRSGNISV